MKHLSEILAVIVVVVIAWYLWGQLTASQPQNAQGPQRQGWWPTPQIQVIPSGPPYMPWGRNYGPWPVANPLPVAYDTNTANAQ